MPIDLAELNAALGEVGLILRGGFHATDDDGLADDIETVMLVGNAGPAMWQAAEETFHEGADPLNRWTQSEIDPIAVRFGGRAVYPFQGPPYYPFQSWAKRADEVFSSPIGILIHPVYGLWHAYRGAILITERLDLPDRKSGGSPCDTCAEKPCLTTCPDSAFSAAGYDVPACAEHLRSAAGGDCMTLGCRARRACPIGTRYTYLPEQAAFHMAAFIEARPK